MDITITLTEQERNNLRHILDLGVKLGLQDNLPMPHSRAASAILSTLIKIEQAEKPPTN